MGRHNRQFRSGAAVLVTLLALAGAACSSSSTNSSSSSGASGRGKIDVVVAENFWGSIAAQLGGDHANVTSIITSPDTDPHAYEPTAQDGRALAGAQYVIFNGLGYDTWAAQAIDANPAPRRNVPQTGNLPGP